MVSVHAWQQKMAARYYPVVARKAASVLSSPSVVSKPSVLRRSADFQRVMERGKRVQATPWLVLLHAPNESQKTRVGWTVSSQVGIAVVRNRLKRWLRAYLQTIDSRKFAGRDLVFIFRRQREGFYKQLSHDEFDRAVNETVRKLEKRDR